MPKAIETNAVREYFTRAADTFDALYSERRQSPAMRVVNRIFRRDMRIRFLWTLEHVRAIKAASILDVGCGSGRYLEAYAELGVRRIVGIDLSDAMLELAAARLAPFTDITDVALIRGDFSAFETDERFDVVVGMGVADYLDDPAAALTKMRSLANHSVVVSFPSISVYRTPIRRIRYWFKRCPVHFYTRLRIESLGKFAGFADTSVRKIRGSGQDYVAVFTP
jgi:2-polyprenyl-3-methyl-5-hydroxy-6-metoxy-1,4-benzoquinol methylase